jgi:hypothetical protein
MGWDLNPNKEKEERWLLKASCGTHGRELEENLKTLRAQRWPLGDPEILVTFRP